MKLYCVSQKHGKSPFNIMAYVEADTPKQAIQFYAEKDGETLSGKIADGFKYHAFLRELPEYFWQMKDYCRPDYIKAAAV